MIEFLFKNPLTLWLRWLWQWSKYTARHIGKHLTLEYMCEISATTFGQYNTVRKFARLRDVTMGDYSYVSRDTQVYHARIGKFCSIGPQVIIGPGEHPTYYVSTHPMFYSTMAQSNPVIVEQNIFEEFPITHIGHDVWIGAKAILKTGITVGNGAIIAAGAVVAADVAPYSIVGGVPAKHIRYRFEPDEIAKLQGMNWWDKDLTWLKANKHNFTDIKQLLNKPS
jgi:acetyltransferase-like isoleucine patch superfamily enzyme